MGSMFPSHCAVSSHSIRHIPLWAPLCNVTYVGPVTTSWKLDWKIAVAAFFWNASFNLPPSSSPSELLNPAGLFRAIMSRFLCEQTHTHTITQITHTIEQTFIWPCDSAHCQLLKYQDKIQEN